MRAAEIPSEVEGTLNLRLGEARFGDLRLEKETARAEEDVG